MIRPPFHHVLVGVVLVLAACSSGCASPALHVHADLAYYEQTAPLLAAYLGADQVLDPTDRRLVVRLIRARGYSLAARAQAEGIDWAQPEIPR